MPSDHLFYVLTLTINGVELHKYLADSSPANLAERNSPVNFQIEEIRLAHLPTNLQEALRYDALDGQLQTYRHQEFLNRRYQPIELFEFEEPESEDLITKKQQKYLRRYLREVDNAVCDLLKESVAALQLHGDAEICALYREISAYPHLEANSQDPQS